MTEWKEIPGFPGYEVSDSGQVRSWRRRGGGLGGAKTRLTEPVLLTREADKDGYLKVRLHLGSAGSRKKMVHRLVLEAFVGPCPEGMEARHIGDNDPSNCSLDNLAWGTKPQNMDDKRRHGTMHTGEAHWMAKMPQRINRGEACPQALLTREQVLEIYNSNERPNRVLAERYGVTISAVHRIRSGKNWRHVTQVSQ